MKHNLFGLTLALISVIIGAGPATAAIREVLPSGVIPTHYDLLVQPDLRALTFRGRVAIDVSVDSPTDRIVLNASGLSLDSVDLDGAVATGVVENAELQQRTISFSSAIKPGDHVLHIDYHGVISRKTLGIFAMDYDSPTGKQRTLATNLEPAAAREVLPCWDEPGRKARFSISVDTPVGLTAFSNMPVAARSPLPEHGGQRVRFAETPPMSTYLLFLGVGDFERVHREVDGIDLGVVVKRGDSPKAAYALDEAARLLHYYNDYFGVRFPLSKLDLIAAPGKITGGSMENWGAIFYSQDHLLLDPASGTEADRQRVFEVVAHEMAHQWFGDLVTMAWWDNLWLNEGFARWMQTYAADALHPEWRTGLRAQDIFEQGKAADASPSTHPIVKPVLTAAQADEAFDNITYDKGAAVITMLSASAGADAFREGVRRYMKAHAFGNTVDADLWREVDAASGRPISAIEKDFTLQDGVPLVIEGGNAERVSLSEGRFETDPASLSKSETRRWRLPLKLQSLSDGVVTDRVLEPDAPLDTSGPLLINAGQTTYARVAYSEAGADALLAHANSLAAVDQLGVLNDAFTLGMAGYVPPERALALVQALSRSDPVVSQRIIQVLVTLDRSYADIPERTRFDAFAVRVLRPLLTRVGTRSRIDDGPGLAILRGDLLAAEARFGDRAIGAWARSSWAESGLSAEDTQNAIAVAGITADAATFSAMQAAAKARADPLAKARLLVAMANVQDAGLAARMIDIALSEETPAGGAPGLLDEVSASHPDLVWRDAIPRINASASIDQDTKWRLTGHIASASALLERIADLQAYEQANVPVEARLPFEGAIASIRQNDDVRRTILPRLDRWIADQARESGAGG